jgi:hypothetical protein
MYWKQVLAGCAIVSVGAGTAAMIGCDAVEKVAGKIVAPGATLSRIDLIEAPTAKEFARYGCHQLLSVDTEICKTLIGNNINPDNMMFSFDIVFDLENNNEKVPIPLVELLLGTTVYQGQDLGTVCISFCDPNEAGSDDGCTSETDAETACDVDSAQKVDEPADLLPTVSELTNLAQSVVAGDVSNDEFRVIPAQESIEAHIQFDFNMATILDLGATIFKDLAQDFVDGRSPSITIPYTMEGNLFFNVPEMGRFAAGFGPLDGEWNID